MDAGLVNLYDARLDRLRLLASAADAIELDYSTLVVCRDGERYEQARWNSEQRRWHSHYWSYRPRPESLMITSYDEEPLTAHFIPSDPGSARAQTLKRGQFSFRPRTDGGLRLICEQGELVRFNPLTGEWLSDSDLPYKRIIFSAATARFTPVQFEPRHRQRLSPLAAKREPARLAAR